MTHIVHACDQALADARLTTTRDLDGPLHSLVTDLRREKAAALGAWGGDIDKKLSILLLRQEPLVQGAVPAQG